MTTDKFVALLPHRPPFRFVDSVSECMPGKRVVASYRVTGDEAFLAGHFPGRPLFPGVIQLEALAQAGAIAVLADPRFTGKLPLFGGLEKVRFRRQVVPGDDLRLVVDLERLASRGGWSEGRASVGDSLACAARLFFVLGPSGPGSGETGPSGPGSGETGPSGPGSGETGPSG
ncbi:MAG: 3-hydroxyacyl-ACP dehydratase FabZ [Actinobacteria bacterium]|nr:3-hydroxyacyl-ACP dehydratase FabZ [Actinomycetota bacterium]MBW3651338.1 3-hydroxyacyl-ACP dehydratase FabZ [Actinomycetota bacterium]